jgi:hypothetical protein
MRRFLTTDGVDSKTMAVFYRRVAGNVRATVWKRNMGADKRYDTAASQFSQPRRCCRGIRGEFIHQGEDGEWVCPDSNDVMEKAGVLTIEEYIQRRRDTILPAYVTRFA